MDKFQAIFEILYFLSAIDGKIDDKELDVIGNFLDANYGKINFSPKAVVSSMATMTAKGMVEELQHAALVFKDSSSAQDRTTVLDFGLQLIAADGKIAPAERDLFFILGNTWNIDMKRFLDSKGIK
ncbi:MAG: TerB family tellurite resistance protein [bacterium]